MTPEIELRCDRLCAALDEVLGTPKPILVESALFHSLKSGGLTFDEICLTLDIGGGAASSLIARLYDEGLIKPYRRNEIAFSHSQIKERRLFKMGSVRRLTLNDAQSH